MLCHTFQPIGQSRYQYLSTTSTSIPLLLQVYIRYLFLDAYKLNFFSVMSRICHNMLFLFLLLGLFFQTGHRATRTESDACPTPPKKGPLSSPQKCQFLIWATASSILCSGAVLPFQATVDLWFKGLVPSGAIPLITTGAAPAFEPLRLLTLYSSSTGNFGRLSIIDLWHRPEVFMYRHSTLFPFPIISALASIRFFPIWDISFDSASASRSKGRAETRAQRRRSQGKCEYKEEGDSESGLFHRPYIECPSEMERSSSKAVTGTLLLAFSLSLLADKDLRGKVESIKMPVIYEHRLDNLPSEKASDKEYNLTLPEEARLIRVRGWDAGDGAPSSVGACRRGELRKVLCFPGSIGLVLSRYLSLQGEERNTNKLSRRERNCACGRLLARILTESEEGLMQLVKIFSSYVRDHDKLEEEAPANSVPAAAEDGGGHVILRNDWAGEIRKYTKERQKRRALWVPTVVGCEAFWERTWIRYLVPAWLSSLVSCELWSSHITERNPLCWCNVCELALIRRKSLQQKSVEESSDVPVLLIECQHVAVLRHRVMKEGGDNVKSAWAFMGWPTRAICNLPMGSKACKRSDILERLQSVRIGALQLGNYEVGSVVIAVSACRGEYVPWALVHTAGTPWGLTTGGGSLRNKVSRRGPVAGIGIFAMVIPLQGACFNVAGRAKVSKETCRRGGRVRKSKNSHFPSWYSSIGNLDKTRALRPDNEDDCALGVQWNSFLFFVCRLLRARIKLSDVLSFTTTLTRTSLGLGLPTSLVEPYEA
ncbi:hypothetical protein Tco_1304811 [Tanacetum coccineum]